ncbi:MAG TPA: cytochrome C oxidase subunit IV family protein [Candidatus Methylacidiphilales bacterium]
MNFNLSHYLRVLGALVLFLMLTTGIAFLPLGGWNWLPSIVISFVMAGLIMLFFMRLRQSEPLLWLTSLSGFAWLSLFLFLVLLDYISRPWSG